MTPLEKKLIGYTNKISKAQQLIDKEMTVFLNKNRTFLAELNTEQLAEGLDETGQPMGKRLPYRNRQYASYKNRVNPLAGLGNPDLRLTGDYWDSITAVVKNKTIQMMALDKKAGDLSIYNGVGIAPENYPEIASLIRTKMVIAI